MVRALTERLPVMICPKWVQVAAQPIAIEDAWAYLLESLELAEQDSRIFEIGGPDQVTYGELMQEYARQCETLYDSGTLSQPLSVESLVGLVTPLWPPRVGRKMVDSMKNPTVVSNNLAFTTFKVRPLTVSKAIV